MRGEWLSVDTLDVEKIRRDFPLLRRKMNGRPLVYLDNAATAQKPSAVIERMSAFYENEYATVHRGVYALSQDSTIECEQVRERCQRFLGAGRKEEIIFVRGATEAINLVAQGYAGKFLEKGDEVLISAIEHHANFVPWQEVVKKKGAVLRLIPVNDQGEIVMEEYERLLERQPKIVAVTHVSNVLGSIFPVRRIIELARRAGARVLVDGAQAVPHLKVNVQELDCDFYCFSGHKLYGPTGIGVLYGKLELLETMEPYQFGGDMIESVSYEKTTFAKPPGKFEAGTPAICEIVGLGAAIDYIERIGLEAVGQYEKELLDSATDKLKMIPDLRIIGEAGEKSSLISFVLKDIHAHDVGTILDREGIAIRAGHHCSQPTMKRFGVAATARASFAFYNTREEVERLAKGIEKVKEVFQ